MDKERRVTQDDLEKIRSELSSELKVMSPLQRREYLKAADQVYNGLAKMAKIRIVKA